MYKYNNNYKNRVCETHISPSADRGGLSASGGGHTDCVSALSAEAFFMRNSLAPELSETLPVSSVGGGGSLHGFPT